MSKSKLVFIILNLHIFFSKNILAKNIPYWNINSFGLQNNVVFNFIGFIPSTKIMNSNPVNILLINADYYNSNDIYFIAPSECKIGLSHISNNNIKIVVNNQEYTNNSFICADQFIKIGGARVFLRLNSLTSSMHGVVQCNNNGMLIYTY